MATHALHGDTLGRRPIAVALLASAHLRQHQVARVLGLLRRVTGQARGVARVLALDQVAAMIEAAGGEVIARETNRHDLEAFEHVVSLRIDHGVTADAAATRKLILDLRPCTAHGAIERRSSARLLFLDVPWQPAPLAR